MLDWAKTIQAKGEAGIQSLIGEVESFEIEFKEKTDSSTPALSKEDKKNIAKEVCGFANAAGGVIVFGVKTETNRNSHQDKVVEVRPITGLSNLLSAIRGVLETNVAPPIKDTELLSVPTDADPENGYVLICVPRSEDGPHMSVATKEHRYYRRTSENTVMMDHRMVRDMMLAPRDADLELSWLLRNRHSRGGSPEKTITADLCLSLVNNTFSTAFSPYILLETISSFSAKLTKDPDIKLHVLSERKYAFSCPRDLVLHPKIPFQFLWYELGASVQNEPFRACLSSELWQEAANPEIWKIGRASMSEPIVDHFKDGFELKVSFGAENALPKHKIVRYSKAQLCAKFVEIEIRKNIQDEALREHALGALRPFGVPQTQILQQIDVSF